MSGDLRFQVSVKGAVSVYGLGRFPVTLYREQWERLLAVAPELSAYLVANADALSMKRAKDAAA